MQISSGMAQLCINLFSLFGTIVVLALSSVYVLIALLPLGIIYYYAAGYYRHSSREVQRLDSISRSPIYTAFSEALGGAPTIAAFDTAPRFFAASVGRFDQNIKAQFIALTANRWLSVRLEFLSNVLLTLTALFAVITFISHEGTGDKVKAGLAGLALAYAPSLTETLNSLLRNFTALETMMVSVERLLNYAEVRACRSEHISPHAWRLETRAAMQLPRMHLPRMQPPRMQLPHSPLLPPRRTSRVPFTSPPPPPLA